MKNNSQDLIPITESQAETLEALGVTVITCYAVPRRLLDALQTLLPKEKTKRVVIGKATPIQSFRISRNCLDLLENKGGSMYPQMRIALENLIDIKKDKSALFTTVYSRATLTLWISKELGLDTDATMRLIYSLYKMGVLTSADNDEDLNNE